METRYSRDKGCFLRGCDSRTALIHMDIMMFLKILENGIRFIPPPVQLGDHGIYLADLLHYHLPDLFLRNEFCIPSNNSKGVSDPVVEYRLLGKIDLYLFYCSILLLFKTEFFCDIKTLGNGCNQWSPGGRVYG
ncbi:MAG: hypothetical protein BWY45_03527 [Euryarchaeota archaeon ADurb.Bin294]|nr:MAG: hypothetical protein BWY45_03527 [Euryarchaeota archaeon ADurb.Bin294]